MASSNLFLFLAQDSHEITLQEGAVFSLNARASAFCKKDSVPPRVSVQEECPPRVSSKKQEECLSPSVSRLPRHCPSNNENRTNYSEYGKGCNPEFWSQQAVELSHQWEDYPKRSQWIESIRPVRFFHTGARQESVCPEWHLVKGVFRGFLRQQKGVWRVGKACNGRPRCSNRCAS